MEGFIFLFLNQHRLILCFLTAARQSGARAPAAFTMHFNVMGAKNIQHKN